MAKKNQSYPTNKTTDTLVLDRFTDSDLRTWKRVSELSEEYHVKLFYHLESLRKIHHKELCDSLIHTKTFSIDRDGWWRIVDHKFSDAPLSAQGSIIKGGRFNIGNDLGVVGFQSFPAFYLAEDEDTARAEKFGTPKAANGLTDNELALRKSASYTAVRLRFELNNVFDLTNASRLVDFTKIISKFQLTTELKQLATELRIMPPYLISKATQLKNILLSQNEWRYYPQQHEIPANSQLFGRMLRDAGFEAVIFPSTKIKKKNNLAVFTENLSRSDSYVELQDPAPKTVKHTKLNSESWEKLSSI